MANIYHDRIITHMTHHVLYVCMGSNCIHVYYFYIDLLVWNIIYIFVYRMIANEFAIWCFEFLNYSQGCYLPGKCSMPNFTTTYYCIYWSMDFSNLFRTGWRRRSNSVSLLHHILYYWILPDNVVQIVLFRFSPYGNRRNDLQNGKS